VWEEPENVKITPPGANTDGKRKAAFKRALRHGKDSKTRFCVRTGTRGRACDDIEHPTKSVASATSSIRAEQITTLSSLETGGGDDATMEAIHVAQRVSFEEADDKTAFMEELGLK
jgi:hypothetical protein